MKNQKKLVHYHFPPTLLNSVDSTANSVYKALDLHRLGNKGVAVFARIGKVLTYTPKTFTQFE